MSFVPCEDTQAHIKFKRSRRSEGPLGFRGWKVCVLDVNVQVVLKLDRTHVILFVLFCSGLNSLIEPAHVIMVLITQATSQGSGEPVHSRQSLRCWHSWSMEIDDGSNQKSDIKPHWMAAHEHLKNAFTEDEKCHNLMSKMTQLKNNAKYKELISHHYNDPTFLCSLQISHNEHPG